MNRRIFLRLILIAALTVSFLLSAAGARVARAAEPPLNLIVWIFSDSLTPTETGVLNTYAGAHGVTFTVYNPADLMAELASVAPDAAPDVLYYTNEAMPMLILDHYLAPLESYGVTSAYLTANFEGVAANAARYGGLAWAVPHFTEGIALVYNKDTSVLPTQYLPASASDFAGLAAKAALYKAAYPTRTLICNQGFATADAYHVAPIFFGFGIPDYIAQGGRVYIDDPRAVTAAQWIQDIHASLADAHDFDTCKNQLIAGNVGMWWTGPWAITWLISGGMDSADIGILPMGVPYVGAKQSMLTASAVSRGHAAEAVAFMLYFSNAANSILYATQESLIPANTAALHSATVQALPIIKGFSQSIALGTPMGKSIYTSCQWDPVANAVLTLWNNPAADPETELEIAQEQAQTCVNSLRETYFPYSLMPPLVRR